MPRRLRRLTLALFTAVLCAASPGALGGLRGLGAHIERAD